MEVFCLKLPKNMQNTKGHITDGVCAVQRIKTNEEMTMSKKSGKEQYLDAKHVVENPNKFDHRDVARAREFCNGYEAGQHETIVNCGCKYQKYLEAQDSDGTKAV